LLTALAVRVEAIEHRLNTSPLRWEDRAALERILPALAGALGSELFLTSEAVTSENPALVLVLGGMNARRLGRLLRRGDGVPVAGHVVRASGMQAGAGPLVGASRAVRTRARFFAHPNTAVRACPGRTS
jgi:hypothetical protein